MAQATRWKGPDSPRLMAMLISAVPHILREDTLWTDRVAVSEVMNKLQCNRDEATQLLHAVVRTHPMMRIVNTGLNIGE